MSVTQLTLNNIINLNECWLFTNTAELSPIDLLGKSLQTWIAKQLDILDVGPNEITSHAPIPDGVYLKGRIYIGEGVKLEPGCFIQGPAIIGPHSEIRHTAYIRGHVFVGTHCVVGHATELKGCVFFDGAKAGHFAYVGDSVLGRQVNLGAGTKIANLKLDNREVKYFDPILQKRVSSGLRKFGAILGDHAQTGCNAVLSPGSILYPNTAVMPCTHFHGTLEKGFFPQSTPKPS